MIDFDKDELFENTFKDENEFTISVCNSMKYEYNNLEFPLHRDTSTWKNLFKKCSEYRKQHRIQENEFVFLLTDIPNENNWFASLDEKNPFNGFIHADDWSFYIECPEKFPVAYEVVALMLQHFTFNSMNELFENIHQRSIGCINDYCPNKKEVILKLRTADICRTCMGKLKERLSMSVIHHALGLLESFRVKMLFAQNFKQELPLSTLLIDNKKKIFLPDFENIEIKLTPLEKALYLLFLKYPEGIYLSSLSEYRIELYEIYAGIANMGDLREMQIRIDDMVNALSDSASQKISKIKKVFENAIGNELAKNYIIKGGNGEMKKISLERSQVRLEVLV